MKEQDQFNEWIKKQVEDNPEQPPEAVWNTVAEHLDLDTTWHSIDQDLEIDNLWTAIDGRLQLHAHMIWWERAGAACAAMLAAVALALPLLFNSPPTDTMLAEQTRQHSLQELSPASPTAPEGNNAETGIVSTDNRSEPSASTATSNTLQKSGAAQQRGRLADYQPESRAASGMAQTDVSQQDLHRNEELPGQAPKRSGTNKELAEAAASQNHFQQAKGNRKASEVAATKSLRMGTVARDLHHETMDPGNELAKRPLAGTNSQDRSSISGSVGGAGVQSDVEDAPYAHGLLHYPAQNRQAALSLQQAAFELPALHIAKAETIVPDKKPSLHTQHWKLGAAASGRITSLLNQKTFRAMEKSTLTTLLPTYGKSFSVQAEKGLSPRFALLADLVLYGETGQRYEEYQGGKYGTTETKLQYSHVTLLGAYSARSMNFKQRPYSRWLAGVSAGWLQGATLSGPLGTNDISAEYKPFAAAVVLGWEMNYPITKRVWVNYGIRGQLDLMNIYAGDGQVPADFRLTRSAFADFTVGFKYQLMKNIK